MIRLLLAGLAFLILVLPQAAAQKAGNVYTFGQAADMAEFAPMPRISSR